MIGQPTPITAWPNTNGELLAKLEDGHHAVLSWGLTGDGELLVLIVELGHAYWLRDDADDEAYGYEHLCFEYGACPT